MACGPILAMYVRSGHGVVAGGLLLGIIAVMKKELVDRDCPFIQKFPPHMNTIRSWRNDWTLVRDPRDGIHVVIFILTYIGVTTFDVVV